MSEPGFDVGRARRASAVAHDYEALMGLPSIVFGACFLLGAATGGGLGWWAVLALVAGGASRGWYRRRYGQVTPRDDQPRWVGVVTAAGFLLAFAADEWWSPPVSATLLAVAAALAASAVLELSRVGLSAVHWAVRAALVVASFAPVVGVGAGGVSSPFVLAVVGGAMVVLGVVDHVRLVRAMAPAGRAASV